MRRTVIACAVTALLLGGGTATASKLISGKDIRDGSLSGADIKNGSVREGDLAQGLRTKLNTTVSASPGAPGTNGDRGDKGLLNVESDGPYPGRTDAQYNLQELGRNLSEGAQSEDAWVGDDGATLQQSWVMCPKGKTALGGGFGDNDGGGQDKLVIVTSAPAQIDPETLALTYDPIVGDEAGSFVPNAWLVEGYNKNADGELIVRPHVVCAKLAD